MASENRQHKMLEVDPKFRLEIYNEDYSVYATLPSEFGFTVGSEYSEPFDSGAMSSSWQKAFAVAGIANSKFGMRMQKMFTNPEPTEMSISIDFFAYKSAKDEVFMPIVYLCLMTLGSNLTWDDVSTKARELAELIQSGADTVNLVTGLNEQVDTSDINVDQENQYGGRMLDLVGLIQSPKKVAVKFGTFMHWRNMYITSVSPNFHTILDKDGFPTKASVSLTITPEYYPIADEMLENFGLPPSSRR